MVSSANRERPRRLWWRNLRPAGVGRLSYRSDALKALLAQGYPFLFFGLAMALQPNIDAVFLTNLGRAKR